MEQTRPDFPVLGVDVGEADEPPDTLESDATVDLTQPGKEPRLVDPLILKERGALKVANKLVMVFGHSLLWPFVGGILLLTALSMRYDPEIVVKMLVEGYLPLLERIGDLALRVFGPLLGFVLGYYFGSRGQTASSDTT